MITKRICSSLVDEVLIDLIEFQAIVAGRTGFNMVEVQRDLDIEFSEIDEVGTIGNDDAEIAFNHVNELLQIRIGRVGEVNYPFQLSNDGSRFTLRSDLTNSGYIYLFCLLLSHPKEDDVLSGDYLPNINDNERRLFQSCSTVAAAGLIKGNAISFGFPRTDGSGFLDKLKQVYSLIEDGQVRNVLIPGTSRNIKDFGIDVIAWLHRQDSRALERYFLAQVASGADWNNKELSNDMINRFHDLFFSDSPKKESERGIFIPFTPEYDRDISLDDKLRIFQGQYGEFHYRFSIPRYYADGYELSQQDNFFHIDGISDFNVIKSWVCTELKRISGIEL